MAQRYYHASPRRLRVGDVLVPGDGFSARRSAVYLSDSAVPHWSIADRVAADSRPWFVYEVAPVGRVGRGDFDEFACARAVVVRCVGNARGLLARAARRFVSKDGRCVGSGVRFRRAPADVAARRLR